MRDRSKLWLFEVIHTFLGLHLGLKLMSVSMSNGWKLIASTWWRIHEGFYSSGRGNSVWRGSAFGVQRDMRLFVTFDQHKSVLVILKLWNDSLWLALLDTPNSLLWSWYHRLGEHLSSDTVSQWSVPRDLVNIIFLCLLGCNWRIWRWVTGRHPFLAHAALAFFLHCSFANGWQKLMCISSPWKVRRLLSLRPEVWSRGCPMYILFVE